MDSYDIFKKLSFGTKFSSKRTRTDGPNQTHKKLKPLSEDNIKQLKGDTGLRQRRDAASDVSSSSLSYNVSQVSSSSSAGGVSHDNYDSLMANNLRLLGDITTAQEKTKKDKKNEATTIVVDERKTKMLQKEKIAQIRNKHHISVLGKDVTQPIQTFEELETKFGVSSLILNNITNSGYKVPTPIQMQAIPLLLQGKQLLACAPTGSGKTAAFLLPVIHSLGGHKKTGLRAVIVCPTRELAKQTHRECLRLCDGTGLKVLIVSKINTKKDDKISKSGCRHDVLITTPNRLVHLLQKEPPVVSLKNVEWLIVDESDKLFEEGVRGFRDQLASIYLACESPSIKRAMFSATQTPHLTKWCRKNLTNLVSVTVGVRNTACDQVAQELLFVGNEHGKLIAFRDLIQKGVKPPVLVFVQTKERAQELFSELVYDGINVDVIHSDRTQLQRDKVVASFREGKIWVLICTELMGRGMDFKGVNCVVNYDFPPSAVSYIHRIGRTGRAGRPGHAITYFTQGDTLNLRRIAQVLKDSGCHVPDYMLTLKRRNKADVKKLEKQAPRRESISTVPVYQKVYDKKLKNAVKRSKRRKKKMNIAVKS